MKISTLRVAAVVLIAAGFAAVWPAKMVLADQPTTAPVAAGPARSPTTAPSAEKIDGLIKQLGDRNFTVREQAQKELIAIGLPAKAAVEKALKSTDAEVASRARTILDEIGTGEVVDNPAYKAWKSFKPGTMVKTDTIVTKPGINAPPTNIVTVATTTLKEVTPEKVVLEVTTPGVSDPSKSTSTEKVEIPAMIAQSKVEPKGLTTKGEGDEDIDLAGKKVKCHWVETSRTEPSANPKIYGKTTTAKTWTSNAVPGAVVQLSRNTVGGGPSTTEEMKVTEFKAAD